jgi:hypothetical protein
VGLRSLLKRKKKKEEWEDDLGTHAETRAPEAEKTPA